MKDKQIKVNSLKQFLELNPNELFNPSTQKAAAPYKEIIKGLRYFRKDFADYDLRKPIHGNTKNKVDKVLQEYISLVSQPAVKLINPTKKRRKALLEFTGQGNQWKKAIVPVTTESEKIRYRKDGTPVLTSKFGSERNLLFNMNNLIKDSDKEVERILRGQKFDCLYLITGNHLLNKNDLENFAKSINALKKQVKEFMNQYANFGDWLRGVKIIDLKNQNLNCKQWSDIYATKRRASRKKAQKKRK